MEGEHLIAPEREEDSNNTTPQECLSPELDTPTPTHTPTHCPPSHHNVDRIRDQQASSDLLGEINSDDVEYLKLQLKEVS